MIFLQYSQNDLRVIEVKNSTKWRKYTHIKLNVSLSLEVRSWTALLSMTFQEINAIYGITLFVHA